MKNVSFLLPLLLLCSCAVRPQIDLAPDGSGRVQVQVDLQPKFADWLQSMGDEAKTLGLRSGASGLFDEAAIRRSAALFPGLRVAQVASPSRERLQMTLAFDDVSALSGPAPADAGHPPLVALERSGSRRALRVYLDYANYLRIRPLIPGADNQLFDVLGPQGKNPYTPAEYDEVLAFTVGDEAPAWARASRIEVTVRVPGRLVSQTGGRAEGNAVVFDIPLIDVMLLRAPLTYSLEYDLGS